MKKEAITMLPYKSSLDGKWRFAYKEQVAFNEDGIPVVPDDGQFDMEMPVPGIWDDYEKVFTDASKSMIRNPLHVSTETKLDLLSRNEFDKLVALRTDDTIPHVWEDVVMSEGSLPNIVGAGWYKKTLEIPGMWERSVVTLEIGGVFLKAWVFVNGCFAQFHMGHSTPFKVDIGDYINPGKPNEIVICVANTDLERIGMSIRGFAGQSGGIYRKVSIYASKYACIDEIYVRTDSSMKKLYYEACIKGEVDEYRIEWSVSDVDTRLKYRGSVSFNTNIVCWETMTEGMQYWSDYNPELYELSLKLFRKEEIIDERIQRFGLRNIDIEGMKIALNKIPTFLRGATDHCYWPITVTVPTDKDYCLKIIGILKRLGFNWIRCHTWVPADEYLDAADELGIMIQVEVPVGFEEQEWIDVCRSCRRHPSVIIYCCGNEVELNDDMIEYLKKMSILQKEYVPDALFNPQEALRGVEYCWGKVTETAFGGNIVYEPFPHNPARLRKIESYSDVLGAYAHGQLSYDAIAGKFREIENELSVYTKPCLSHEIGIQGTYIDIGLEYRYHYSRIGPELFEVTRKTLEKMDLVEKAADYYIYSCKFHRLIRKQTIENARKCKLTAGYDYLGPNDSHAAFIGYPCGILNEFFELKPGETEELVRKYNNDSVLLLDIWNERNYRTGEKFSNEIYVSNYWHSSFRNASIEWYLTNGEGAIYANGDIFCGTIPRGDVFSAGKIEFTMPAIEKAERLILKTVLKGSRHLENEWELYCFPVVNNDLSYDFRMSGKETDINGVRVTSRIDREITDYINDGGTVLLLGKGGFPAMPIQFKNCLAGRTTGVQATMINFHPSVKNYPADGYCDYSFYSMMEGGHAYIFDHINELPFVPIIEIVSSFKKIMKLSALFELRIGSGRLIACSLNFMTDDPGCAWFADGLLRYAQSAGFDPEHSISKQQFIDIISRPEPTFFQDEMNMAFDPNVQIIKNVISRSKSLFPGKR